MCIFITNNNFNYFLRSLNISLYITKCIHFVLNMMTLVFIKLIDYNLNS